MKVLRSTVSVVSFLLQHVILLELFLGIQLFSLGSFDGGEYSASGVLAFHILLYLSLVFRKNACTLIFFNPVLLLFSKYLWEARAV